MAASEVRRVVTGVADDGSPIVVSDGPVPATVHPRRPDQVLTSLWTARQVPTSYAEAVDDGDPLTLPLTGIRVVQNRLPPDGVLYVDDQGRPREPEPSEYLHRTPTVDFVQVTEGELWLVLDGGEEVHLRAGDCVVQHGPVHGWRNRTTRPTTFLAVVVAADDATSPARPAR